MPVGQRRFHRSQGAALVSQRGGPARRLIELARRSLTLLQADETQEFLADLPKPLSVLGEGQTHC
jgi:hypothetical protein